jgi:predicted phosphodiesterase
LEVIEKTIEHKRPDIFKFYPLGDIHLGSIHCSENDIKDKIKQISSEKNSYIIGMGDYCDSILLHDKRFDIGGLAPWVEKDNIVTSQKQACIELFNPVKSKIIGMLTGNHEETIHKYHQEHITKNICKELSIPYAGYHCYINLRFDRQGGTKRNYLIHAWHGSGASQTEGARLNRLTRLVNDIQADIYLMGHLHAMTQHTPDRLTFRNGRIKSIKLAATITGSWLKAYTQGSSSYAEEKGYKPSRIGCPCICINPDKDDFWIES